MAAEDEGTGFSFETGIISGKKVDVPTERNPSWFTGYYEHSFTPTLGIYALVEKESDGYREFYVGPKWKPLEWLEVGIAAGREITREMPNSARRNAYVAIDTDKVSAYITYENGGSGPWHKAYALYKVTETVSAGVMNETFFGCGPRVEYAIAKNVTTWGALLRNSDIKATTSLFAVTYSF
jgi:hypothetical protein